MDNPSQIIINIVLSTSIIVLIGFFYQLQYGITKFSNLSHAALVTTGPYGAYLFISAFSLTFPIAILLSVLVTIGIGLLFEWGVYGRMRKQNVSSTNYLVASIGLYLVWQNVISLYFGDDTKSFYPTTVTIGMHLGHGYITNIQLLTIITCLGLFVLGHLGLRYTVVGKAIRAVASNAELCTIYGIDDTIIIRIAVGTSSALAAIVGILSAMDTNMYPAFGFNLLLYGVAAMIIGGVGSTTGLVGGATLIATIQHFSTYYLGGTWMNAVTYGVLILFLIWRPLGFSGKRLKKVDI